MIHLRDLGSPHRVHRPNLPCLGDDAVRPHRDEDGRLRELMLAFRRGEEASWLRLYAACRPVIVRTARRVGAHGDAIEDIVQDTLLTLHQTRDAFDPSRSAVAWLTVLSRRRAIDVIRRQRRRDRREVHSPVAYEGHAAPDLPDAWLDAVRARQVESLVGARPAGQREAIDLIARRGFTLSEASLVAGRSRGALKVAFHRAIGTLSARRDEAADTVSMDAAAIADAGPRCRAEPLRASSVRP